MNSKMILISSDEFLSAGQYAAISGIYGNAACKTIPKSIAIPLKASNP
jgi:hypothetical protein